MSTVALGHFKYTPLVLNETSIYAICNSLCSLSNFLLPRTGFFGVLHLLQQETAKVAQKS